MLRSDVRQISREEKIDVAEIAQMARKLPDKEKERFYYMMQGVALMSDEECHHMRAGA
ncbi:MAG: hypothetical protein MR935_04040 [Agathobaculum sp.]|uniref:hypothetical protein n=1 Tax=Agathobaculum sp. TaxID=2048138 RepID=UPI0025B7BAD9|nr:hypothetical protein [Agathobaculum sp.]MCI7125362.1 hypothetical protein [Agathobaculum sp.]MDY3711684.1 hypothetical protein [Agathobaculum sp.]